MTIHVDIVSAEGSIYSGEAERVFVPGKMGELGIAPRHSARGARRSRSGLSSTRRRLRLHRARARQASREARLYRVASSRAPEIRTTGLSRDPPGVRTP